MKILVAYFSASGVTAGVAKRLASAVGADLREIKPALAYSAADLDWRDKNSRSSREMADPTSRPTLAEPIDASGYDAVFVGFPIWWYREPSIVDTFAQSGDFAGKLIAPFATSGGSGMGESAGNIASLAKGARVVGGRRFEANASEAELGEWARGILGQI